MITCTRFFLHRPPNKSEWRTHCGMWIIMRKDIDCICTRTSYVTSSELPPVVSCRSLHVLMRIERLPAETADPQRQKDQDVRVFATTSGALTADLVNIGHTLMTSWIFSSLLVFFEAFRAEVWAPGRYCVLGNGHRTVIFFPPQTSDVEGPRMDFGLIRSMRSMIPKAVQSRPFNY